MKYKFIRLMFLFIFSILYRHGESTHIVGGVVYYEYIGNNTFKILFEIYRDCDNSKEFQIGFDGHIGGDENLPDFYFSIFEDNGVYNIQRDNNLTISSNKIQNIRPVITNRCLKRDGTCVEKGTYEYIFRVPDPTKSYTIQYQRCCRNDGILNIQNQLGEPDKPGITIKATIPPISSITNNSAKFKQFPPIFICANRPFIFDHSAQDVDGDILRYSLATPLAGLNSREPFQENQYPGNTPISWQAPYSIDNVMGGTPPLAIDSITGELSCNPDRVGRFVVSIKVDEIRNNKIINTTIRDFQYNVRPCDIPFANTPYIDGTLDINSRDAEYIRDCEDLTVEFISTSSNATSYRWEFGDGNSSTQKNPTHTYSAPGTYNITHYAYKTIDGELCEDKVTRKVFIYPKLKANFSYLNDICEGININLENKSSTDYGTIVKYKWDFGDGITSTKKNPDKKYNTNGTYSIKLTIENSHGCTDQIQKNITVNPTPIINNKDISGCVNQAQNLDCDISISSGNIALYEWTLPDGTKDFNCNTSYNPPNIGTFNITLKTESNKGCKAEKELKYQVFPLPNVKTINNTKICHSTSIKLTTSGANRYKWSPSNFLDDPNKESPLSSPIYPDSITYVVEGKDNNGCYNYDTVTITFFKKLYIDAGIDRYICLESNNYKDTVHLSPIGDTFQSYSWSPQNFLDNSNIRTPIASPKDNISYQLTAIDKNNCKYNDSLKVYVLNHEFNILPLDSLFICQYDTIQIFSKDQGDTSTYSWSPDLWISNPNIKNPYFYPLDTQLYILFISNFCYEKYDSIIINSNELPDPKMLDLDSICVGDTYYFNINSELPFIRWTTSDKTFSNTTIHNPNSSPSVHTWYYVYVRDTHGCENRDSMLLEVNYPPVISIFGIKRFICLGDSLPLRVDSDKGAKLLWWDSKYLSSDTSYEILAFPPDTMKFYIQSTSIQGCINHDSLTINVQQPVRPYALSPLSICNGDFIDLYAKGGLYYLWQPSDFLNDTIIDTPQANPDRFIRYKVYVSNDCFIDSTDVNIYVHPLPEIKAYSDTTIYRGAPLTLYANTSASKIDWNPKNEIDHPFHNSINVSPIDTTIYIVRATNQFNCESFDTITVNVYGKSLLLIPTAFTPNRDGNNDLFGIIKHLNIKNLESLEVFNRWGETVFSTTNIEEKWDGKYKNEKCMNGVYVWTVKAVNYENEHIIKSGNVTLIR